MLAKQIQFCIKKGRIGLVPILFLAIVACAGSQHAAYHHYEIDTQVLSQSNVPLVMNDKVLAWVNYFAGPGRKTFIASIQRGGRYEGAIRRILNIYGLPSDLIYLAMIESGFSETARSPAAAVGIWQFIQSTGERYGLKQDNWIDERQNVEKATHAAAQYLYDLHSEFGDWYLAMAAYNSGEGTVRQAIARYGSRDYWDLSDPQKSAFRPETQDYVPKYIAAAIIAKNPMYFGFNAIQPELPTSYEEVLIDTPIDVGVVAKCAQVNVKEVERLNSELKRGIAPAHYPIKLPLGKTTQFKLALANIKPEHRTKMKKLLESKDEPHTYYSKKMLPLSIERVSMHLSKNVDEVISYQVQEGDTYLSISRQYKINATQLKRLSQARKGGLRPGDLLTFRLDG